MAKKPDFQFRRIAFVATVFAVAFQISATTKAATIFDETFDYPDGPITTNSSGAWTTVSGTAGQLNVTGGQANMTFSNSEDIARNLDNSYSSGTLYYSALITMTAIPGTGQYGAYLMHLSDTDTGIDTDFFARLYVKAVDDQTFYYGIRNRSLAGGSPDYPTVFDESTPITLNTQVAIVVKFDFDTLQTTLWINPVDEDSPSVTDTYAVAFAGADQTLSRFSLREASFIGTSGIDEIKTGTDFADVYLAAVPEPGVLGLVLAGVGVIGLSRLKARLQRSC